MVDGLPVLASGTERREFYRIHARQAQGTVHETPTAVLAPGGFPDGPHLLVVEIQIPSGVNDDAGIARLAAELKAAIHLEFSYLARGQMEASTGKLSHLL